MSALGQSRPRFPENRHYSVGLSNTALWHPERLGGFTADVAARDANIVQGSVIEITRLITRPAAMPPLHETVSDCG
jgi:hypothetical protein